MKTATINDGMYFLHPEGGCWIAVKYRKGKCVARAYEADYGTHSAAKDSWAGVCPSDNDVEMSGDEALTIIADVIGEDTYSECVVVFRMAQ